MASKIKWNTGGEDTNDSKYDWYNKLGKSYELPIPVLEGYEFDGWYNYDPNYPRTLEKIERILADDNRQLRLYAKWKKDGDVADVYEDITPDLFCNIRESKTEFLCSINYYTSTPLTEEILEKSKFRVGEKIELPIPTRENYIFGGWYDYNDRGNNKTNPMPIKITSIPDRLCKRNFRLYAKWIDKDGNIDDCYRNIKPADFIKADKRYERYLKKQQVKNNQE